MGRKFNKDSDLLARGREKDIAELKLFNSNTVTSHKPYNTIENRRRLNESRRNIAERKCKVRWQATSTSIYAQSISLETGTRWNSRPFTVSKTRETGKNGDFPDINKYLKVYDKQQSMNNGIKFGIYTNGNHPILFTSLFPIGHRLFTFLWTLQDKTTIIQNNTGIPVSPSKTSRSVKEMKFCICATYVNWRRDFIHQANPTKTPTNSLQGVSARNLKDPNFNVRPPLRTLLSSTFLKIAWVYIRWLTQCCKLSLLLLS